MENLQNKETLLVIASSLFLLSMLFNLFQSIMTKKTIKDLQLQLENSDNLATALEKELLFSKNIIKTKSVVIDNANNNISDLNKSIKNLKDDNHKLVAELHNMKTQQIEKIGSKKEENINGLIPSTKPTTRKKRN